VFWDQQAFGSEPFCRFKGKDFPRNIRPLRLQFYYCTCYEARFHSKQFFPA